MTIDLKSLLGSTYLTDYVQSVKTAVADNRLNPAFLSVTEDATGDVVEWFERKTNRQTATTTGKGSPSRKVTKKDEIQRTAKAIHSFEHIAHKAAVLEQLKSPNANEVAKGVGHFRYQAEEFKRRFSNARNAAVMSALALGAIYYDGDGNLLPSSSGAVQTIDLRVPSGNKNQLDWNGGGPIISASWATAGTDIPKHVKLIKNAGWRLTGCQIAEAYYGSNILGYLSGNTIVKEWMKSHGVLTSALGANEIPDGFLGIEKWYPADGWFYEDQNGTTQEFVGGDTCIFTPKPDKSWYTMFNATNLVSDSPTQVFSDALAALNAMKVVSGMASFAALTIDPPGINQYGMDSFLPTFLVPGAIFIADVTP